MKNTQEDSIFRKKGFFIALYSCLGVVAALAVVVTIATRGQYDTNQDMAYYNEEAVAVGYDQVESYLAQADDEAWFRPRQQPTPTPAPPPQQEIAPPQPSPEITPPASSAAPAQDYYEDEDAEVYYQPDDTHMYEQAVQEVVEVAYFNAFTESDSMVWPVYGEVVMPFSMSQFIYDPTLDQFRVNDHMRISADEGDPVRAVADGRVVAVGREARRGHYIKIDHGNGWATTYGQLMENPLVSEGEVVRSGQVIGGVGRQTIFTSLDGTHVHLRVTRDDEPVNPYEWLAAR